jgi:hypothetical protein
MFLVATELISEFRLFKSGAQFTNERMNKKLLSEVVSTMLLFDTKLLAEIKPFCFRHDNRWMIVR